MKTTHTKGEWFAVDYAGSYIIQDSNDYTGRDILAYDSYRSIDDDEFVNVPKEEVEANIKLILSAPDLLEALSNMVNAFSNDTFENMAIAMADAKAAIKKATE